MGACSADPRAPTCGEGGKVVIDGEYKCEVPPKACPKWAPANSEGNCVPAVSCMAGEGP